MKRQRSGSLGSPKSKKKIRHEGNGREGLSPLTQEDGSHTQGFASSKSRKTNPGTSFPRHETIPASLSQGEAPRRGQASMVMTEDGQQIFVRKDGQLDMRYKSNRIYLEKLSASLDAPIPDDRATTSSNAKPRSGGSLPLNIAIIPGPSSNISSVNADDITDISITTTNSADNVSTTNCSDDITPSISFSENEPSISSLLMDEFQLDSSQIIEDIPSPKSPLLLQEKIPRHIPLTKSKIPNMKSKLSREWVEGQARKHAEFNFPALPSWIPRQKDGRVDFNKSVSQCYLTTKENHAVPLPVYNSNRRANYYNKKKLENSNFYEYLIRAKQDPVDDLPYILLHNSEICESYKGQRWDTISGPSSGSTKSSSSLKEASSHLKEAISSFGDGSSSFKEASSSFRAASSSFRAASSSFRAASSSFRAASSSIREASPSFKEASSLTQDIYQIPTYIPKWDYDTIRCTIVNRKESKIGNGAFGIVYKGWLNGKEIAIKELFMDPMSSGDKMSFVKELRILAALGDHPNLVTFYGYTIDPCTIIMEFVRLGCLNHLLYYCQDDLIEAKLCEGRIKKRIVQGIVMGMRQLHSVGIIHGDLKPANILVTDDFSAKITDFGLARLRAKSTCLIGSHMLEDGENVIAGTAAYMAPELLDIRNKVDYSTDVYAFGILLNEIVHEEEPYADKFEEIRGREVFAAAYLAQRGERPHVNRNLVPGNLRNLILNCWEGQSGNRPDFDYIAHELHRPDLIFPSLIDIPIV